MEEKAVATAKKKWYLRWWMIVIYVILGLSFIGSLGNDSNSPSASSITEPEAPIEAIKVTSTQLSTAYQANEVAADAKYKGKTVEITGTVEDIGKDILEEAYVTFSLGQYEIINKVQCYFEKRNQEQMVDIKQGERITLRGIVDGGSFNIIVKECEIVN